MKSSALCIVVLLSLAAASAFATGPGQEGGKSTSKTDSGKGVEGGKSTNKSGSGKGVEGGYSLSVDQQLGFAGSRLSSVLLVGVGGLEGGGSKASSRTGADG